jgi:hypothetical protein
MTAELERRVTELEHELVKYRESINAIVGQMRDDLNCIRRAIERYEPYLKDQIEARRRKDGLRRAVIEKSLVGAVWAVILFVGYSIWEYLKRQLRS